MAVCVQRKDFRFLQHSFAPVLKAASLCPVNSSDLVQWAALHWFPGRASTPSQRASLTSLKPRPYPLLKPLLKTFLFLPVSGFPLRNFRESVPFLGLPRWLVKNLRAISGDTSSIPVLGRSPGGGNGNPLQYSCLRIPCTEEAGGLQSIGSQRIGHN